MRWFSRARRPRSSGPILAVEKLDVYYGRAHALQEVSLSLDRGATAVVGRNGMGKTTLCNAITGLVPASGSVRLAGEEILGLPPHAITNRGVGYVPQGRRVWPSLTVDEHLRLAAGGRSGAWTVARVYQTFPRLAERKGHGGAELSGGEQQMLAIARALLFNPILLVMDEPTEGLAPVIVRQVADMLKHLAADGEISVLLIEQNLGVAIEVADTVDVMVNGRIARSMPAAELGADRELQQRLLGVKVGEDEAVDEESAPADGSWAAPEADAITVYTVKRAGDEDPSARREADAPAERAVRGFTRWNAADPTAAPRDRLIDSRRGARDPGPAPDGGGRRSRGERPCGAGRGVAGSRHRRPRRVRRRHVRHQGPRAVLHAQLPGEARASHRHGGSLDLREAVARDDPSARGGAASSQGRARRVHGRPRLGGERDGSGLRALRRAAARPGRPHLRRGLRRHRAGHGRHAQPAHRRAQGDGVLGGVRAT